MPVAPEGRRCPPLPDAVPDEDLLLSGVAVLSGGCDSLGLPLITFPTKNHHNLQQLAAPQLCQLIKYYISLTRSSQRLNGFVFLADLRMTPSMRFTVIIEALEKLQKENRGSVAVFYIIQPRAKESLKHLRKLLGIKHKRRLLHKLFHKTPSNYDMRNENNCIFKSILLLTPAELYKYFDRPKLTQDFGGSMPYSHESWVQFRQATESLTQDIEKVFQMVPDTQDKLDLLKEYDIPDTEDDANNLLAWIRNRYHDVMRVLNIEQVVDECTGIITKCRNPDKHAIYCDLIKCPMLEEVARVMEKHHQRLVTTRKQLQAAWQLAESRMVCVTTVNALKLKSEKHVKWIEEDGLQKLKGSVESAGNLSQAEINKNHFETGLYAQGKEKLRDADEVVNKIYEVTMKLNTEEMQDIMEYVKTLQAKVAEFRFQLEKRFQFYLDVYHFFLLTGKVLRWYRRTLDFIPIDHLNHYNNYRHDEILPLTQPWKRDVSKYLFKHPAPRDEHVQRIKDGIPLVKDMKTRNKSRLVVYRVGLLRMLLVDENIIVADFRQLIQLKLRAKQGYDDLDSSLSRSLPDISQIHDEKHRHSDGEVGSRTNHTLDARPKVKINPFADHLSKPHVSHQPTLGVRVLLERPHSAIPFIHQNTSESAIDFDVMPDSDTSSSLHRPQRRKPAIHGSMQGFDMVDASTRLRLLNQTAPSVHDGYNSMPTEARLRKFNSQPNQVGPKTSSDESKTHRPRNKHTPGRRFLKARDQKSLMKSTPDLDSVHSAPDDAKSRENKRSFSFHRNPVDMTAYGIYNSDEAGDSVFSSLSKSSSSVVVPPLDHLQERYISLSYPNRSAASSPALPVTAAEGDIFFSNTLPVSSRRHTYSPSIGNDVGVYEEDLHPRRAADFHASLPNIGHPDNPTPRGVMSNSDEQLLLTKDNLDRISHSDLTPSEKLGLMSGMLERLDSDSSSRSQQRRKTRRSVEFPRTTLPKSKTPENIWGLSSTLPLPPKSVHLTEQDKQIISDILRQQHVEWELHQNYLREEGERRQRAISLAEEQLRHQRSLGQLSVSDGYDSCRSSDVESSRKSDSSSSLRTTVQHLQERRPYDDIEAGSPSAEEDDLDADTITSESDMEDELMSSELSQPVSTTASRLPGLRPLSANPIPRSLAEGMSSHPVVRPTAIKPAAFLPNSFSYAPRIPSPLTRPADITDGEEEDTLAYTIQRLAESSPYPAPNQQKDSRHSQSEYSSHNISDVGSLAHSHDTDRGYYDEESDVDQKSQFTGTVSSDWVTRFDKQPKDNRLSSPAQQTSDLGSEHADAFADIKELANLETSLTKHAFLQRQSLLEQSRNRMLKDLIDMDLIVGAGEIR